ncbi:MAG: hypothetical protein OSB83_05945 [Planctomycetota bacterium]|nr:hypothetical protein [Planctomycetota bacterium]
MLVSRDAMRAFGLILLLALSMVGCQSAPEQITSKVETDDFGGALSNKEEITVESVQKAEMMYQRAQAEFRLGPSFPFDLADPGRDPHTKIGIVGGGKLQLETAKNIYMGLSVDWTDNVVEANTSGVGEQVFAVRGYDRLSVLGTLDYDIPLTEDSEGLLLRMGVGIGMTFIDFNTLPSFTSNPQFGKIEDIYQIMFRPSIGLRFPVSDNLLLFSELSYDIVPERRMAFETDVAVAGQRAIFSSGALLFGVSLQW